MVPAVGRRPGRGDRLPIWPGIPLGAATGAIATIIAALGNPALYIDWGGLAGALVIVPLFTTAAAAVVAIPLAVKGLIARMAVVLALTASIITGELIFQVSLGTPFARWSAARHWTAVEQRAAAEREAAEREVCRQVMALSEGPPPPAPLGSSITRGAAPARPGSTSPLTPYDQGRCRALLAR
ncbi:MAG: hypothetical protein H0X69_05010 [Gemmatimonadales bacterium]|nr:hypothetical protein [Gemmatimonadales bacterium]